MDSITRATIRDEALRRGWTFEGFFHDESYYKITDTNGKWRLGRGSRVGAAEASGVFIAMNKLHSYEFIESLGYRVPPFIKVPDLNTGIDFMKTHGSIVVKPLDSEQSKGVTVGVDNERKLIEAISIARRFSKIVIVQAQLEGALYRVLVVAEKVVAVAERTPAFIDGDGIHTIEQLIRIKNTDPRRRNDIASILKPIGLEHARRFLGADVLGSIPAKAQRIIVDEVASVSRGGESREVTHMISKSLESAFVAITKKLGLSICGFDIMTPDISLLQSHDYLPIVEANSMPGLKIHLFPTAGGQSINPAPLILDTAFRKE